MVIQNNNDDDDSNHNNDNRINNGIMNDENRNNHYHRPLRNEHRPHGPPVAIPMVEVLANVNHNNHNHNVPRNNNNPNRNLIQDLDGWLESNGLRSMDDVIQDDDMSSYNNHQEEWRRIRDEERYAQSIHQKAFYKDIIKEQKEREHKKRIIQSLHDKTMNIRTSNDEIIYNIPLHCMANVCDTIFTMVQNKSLWDHYYKDKNHNNNNNFDEDQSILSNNCFLQLSLESYSKPTVQEFVNLCLSYHSDDDDDDDDGDGDYIVRVGDENTNTKNQGYYLDGKRSSVGTTKPSLKSSSSSISRVLHQITDDAIVLDCCRIGHYLMAQHIVDTIIHDVLVPNIDTNNCFTLYTLADELNLTSSTLLQRTLSHMIHTIGEYSQNDDQNDNDEWNNDMYSQELNERLRTMKRALESSVHGGHCGNSTTGSSSSGGSSGPQRLYFASMEEYLSIFAERVQYYRERLHEAKECQKRQQQQYQDLSAFTIRGRVISSSYQDAEKKIQKQEQRVRTLEIAYAEQKALFRSNSNSSSGGKNI